MACVVNLLTCWYASAAQFIHETVCPVFLPEDTGISVASRGVWSGPIPATSFAVNLNISHETIADLRMYLTDRPCFIRHNDHLPTYARRAPRRLQTQ